MDNCNCKKNKIYKHILIRELMLSEKMDKIRYNYFSNYDVDFLGYLFLDMDNGKFKSDYLNDSMKSLLDNIMIKLN